MSSTGFIQEVLGETSGAGLPALHDLITEGLPARVITVVEERLGLSAAESARLLAVSPSTRKRLKRTPTKRLDPALSDRLVRVVRTLDEATGIFADEAKARGWFHTRQPALRDSRPVELVATDPGAQLVHDELARIKHGFWA